VNDDSFARGGTATLGCVTLLVALSAGAAAAVESGSSFYLLGQRGAAAAVLPPAEGWFFALPTYYYSGHASDSSELPIGGVASLGLDAEVVLLMPTAVWVTSTDLFGGDLAFSGTLVYGNADMRARAAVSIPGIVDGSVDLLDDRWVVGDPAFSVLVGWPAEDHHYLVAASVNVPVGGYDAGRLSNVALHRWVGDLTAAGTWLFADKSIELSGAVGLSFNGENSDTDYRSGTESHLEVASYYQFSPNVAAGVGAYHYQQLSPDGGAGATLGDFEGRATGLGPGLTATFAIGAVPVSVGLSYFREFNVKNRLLGDAGWLTITIPLWVPGG
jgi:hypothetical protein